VRTSCIFVALAALGLASITLPASAQEPEAEAGVETTSEDSPDAADARDPSTDDGDSAESDGGAAAQGGAEGEEDTAAGTSEGDATAESAGDGAERLRADHGRDAPEEPAKVAVVTVGDPDDGLRDQARELDRLFSRTDGLRIPTDSGLRRALRGDPAPDEDDGLGRVRVLRRGLGIDDEEDAGGLSALGRVSGAVAVVAIRRRAGSIEATALDVASGRLYEGELELNDAGDAAIVRFVLPRARASALRAAERAADADRRDWRGGAAAARDGAGSGAGGESATPSEGTENGEEDEEEPGFFAKWWPYMVGALLLGAMVTYFVVTGNDDPGADLPSPVLRFIPGGN